MDIGVLARALLLKQQLNDQPCERCGLLYDKHAAKCPHCGDLDDDELQAMLAENEQEREANVPMGRLFLVIGIVLGALVFFAALKR